MTEKEILDAGQFCKAVVCDNCKAAYYEGIGATVFWPPYSSDSARTVNHYCPECAEDLRVE